MNLKATAVAITALSIAAFAGASGSLKAETAHANPANRITVYVAGPLAGTVDIDVDPSLLPDELMDYDTGDIVMPTTYCGLRIENVGGIYWYDQSNNLIEAENHGEVTVSGNAYHFMGEDVTDAYLGGMAFTGPISTCDENPSWAFPIPLSYGGNAPQFGAAKLVLELDEPPAFQPTIEFLDSAFEPIELPDLDDGDSEPHGGIDEACHLTPEFCEEPADVTEVAGCLFQPSFDCPDGSSKDPMELTLGCMAYAIGCNPDPKPIDTFVATSPAPDTRSATFDTTKTVSTKTPTR